MEDITVHSWNDLNDQLYAGAWQEPIARFRSSFVFRGVSDANHNLETSLRRLGGPESAHELESPVLRAFRRYAHRYGPGDSGNAWNWLALAQHHGLPTRLLDWTYSPFVALHFATCELWRHDRDAAVWCVDFNRTNEFLPSVLKDILEQEGAGVFTAEMLARAADNLAAFDALAPEPFALFFEPPSLDDRIVNQFALFSCLSDAAASLTDWLRGQDEGVCKRLIIPASLKSEIRDKLDQANITERVLFPGLDGLSQWLARYYTPRKSGAAETNEPLEPPP